MFSSDVESLKKGIIKRSENNVRADYTILLVGETGFGKFTFVQFLANVLMGNNIDRYDLEMFDLSNKHSGSHNQSKTNSLRFYNLTSKNGILVSVGELTWSVYVTPFQGSHSRHTWLRRHLWY